MKEPLLVSRCLLGENVRYDGGNCRQNNSILNKLEDKYILFPICPEVMAGMSTPREPIEILENCVITKSGEDVTELFTPVFKKLKKLVDENNIRIAILKDFSPSCGSTEIYNGKFDGNRIKGAGIVTSYLNSLNVEVHSEDKILELLK
jgi:uncharacterized protein YbbK (DUF523 family)